MEHFEAWAETNFEENLAVLIDYLRVPTLAGQGVGVPEGAEATAALLAAAGVEPRLIDVPGAPPVVYGEIGEGPRTLMVYDHYDVQPAEPLDLWTSAPYEPTIRDGRLYARGAADNRGELAARVRALAGYRATMGEPPLKIKFVFEGEEEIGSPHLGEFVAANRDMLEADGCLWEGGGWDDDGNPEMTLGLKGIAYFDLRVRSADADLHSSLAAIVPDAAWRLVWALASLKDADERITIEGFMARVVEPGPEDLALLERLPLNEAKIRETTGIARFVNGLTGLALKRKLYFEPTCTICGLTSGYGGPGAKTVLPAEASAKVDFRLVPDLDPPTVERLLRDHLDRHGFADIETRLISGVAPARSPVNADIVRAAIATARAIWGMEPAVSPNSPG
ncbi:MAG: M20/M25/M40 family metallo-hydrolase, partial [Thermomicrobiales bacterium]|nr:M20/M25/M40 family metallo-hydrolase [Thermomicrobiales bacterium]